MARKVLITGAGGFIGGALLKKLQHLDPIGVDFDLKEKVDNKNFIEADLRDEALVKEIFDEHKPDTIFHLAALSSPQRNEEYPDLAKESNTGITKHIVNNLPVDAHIIFPSTDKIFDGSDPNPDEDAEAKPLWLYADLKYQCEGIIKTKTDKYHIVRLPIVHSTGKLTAITKGAGPGSFIDKAIIDIKAGREVVVFENVERCFLRREELICIFETFIDDTRYGTYHVGTSMMNYYQRLCSLCDELDIDWKGKITPAQGKANPLVQNLKTEKLKKTFEIVLT